MREWAERRLAELERERTQLQANVHAFDGAIQTLREGLAATAPPPDATPPPDPPEA